MQTVSNLAKCGYLCIMYAYYLYTILQSRKLEPNPVRCQNIVELITIVFPCVCGGLTSPECTVNIHILRRITTQVQFVDLYKSNVTFLLLTNKQTNKYRFVYLILSDFNN